MASSVQMRELMQLLEQETEGHRYTKNLLLQSQNCQQSWERAFHIAQAEIQCNHIKLSALETRIQQLTTENARLNMVVGHLVRDPMIHHIHRIELIRKGARQAPYARFVRDHHSRRREPAPRPKPIPGRPILGPQPIQRCDLRRNVPGRPSLLIPRRDEKAVSAFRHIRGPNGATQSRVIADNLKRSPPIH